MKTIIIFKSESESSESYAKLLKASNFEAIFVPTLGFSFKNLDILKEKLLKPEKYSGLILTSPRSVESVCEALGKTPLPEAWKTLHNYCVGEVTHNLAMSSLNELITKGKETGSANSLADYIKEHFEGERCRPFLFPCGNLRQDTLQIRLTESGFCLDPCEVYTTSSHPELAENLANALSKENVEYLAFFSPSGVNYCFEYFSKNDMKFNGKKLVAIGPSTRKALESKHLPVYKTCEKPSVEYLIKALVGKEGSEVETKSEIKG